MIMTIMTQHADEVQQSGIIRRLRQIVDFGEPPVFSLHTIYDQASLDTLCEIARISRFRRSVAEYYRYHFRGKAVWLTENYRPDGDYFNQFRHHIQHVRVCGADERLFKYVAYNFPQLTKITFHDMLDQSSGVSHDRAGILFDTMETVRTVEFNVHHFCGGIYDRLLQSARNNIQVLLINSSSIDPNQSHKNRWCTRIYPQLKVVQWDDGIVSNPRGFERFLIRNNVTHLKFTREILLAIDFVKNAQLRLHRLDVGIQSKDLRSIGLIFSRLNQLYETGCFTQMHITCHDPEIFNYQNGLRKLAALRGITHRGKYVRSIGQITQLTDLTVDSMEADDGLTAANQLINLRTLHINRASLDSIRPFISDAPTVMKIVIRNVKREPLDSLGWLITQRNRWVNAVYLKIYLDEWAYCMLKAREQSTNRVIILRADEPLN